MHLSKLSSIYSNTPLIQVLLEDGPQFKAHLAWLVALELGILQTLDRQLPFHYVGMLINP